MPVDRDSVLLESVVVHRARLRGAFLHGDLVSRRATHDNVRRLVVGGVLAVVLAAGCAATSFVQANIASLRPSTASTPGAPAASAPAAGATP